MLTLSVAEILPILQTAIGPTILISGVGLLLLTMTNRLGRVIDRYRVLLKEIQNAPAEKRGRYDIQLKVLWRRAKLVRMAIALAAASQLLASVLIIVIFSVAVTHVEITWLIGSIFIICMLCLISAMVAFLWDINLSVASFKHEFGAYDIR